MTGGGGEGLNGWVGQKRSGATPLGRANCCSNKHLLKKLASIFLQV